MEPRRERNLKLTMRIPKFKSQEEENKHVWSGKCKKENYAVVRQEDEESVFKRRKWSWKMSTIIIHETSQHGGV